MRVINTVEAMVEVAEAFRARGQSLGLVPTMGYLHEGHMSLVRRSKKENAATVLSIFVNPAQFGSGEDLDRYPRDMEGDLYKCDREDVDLVLAPSAAGMYPDGFCTYVDVEGVTAGLCGTSRPGHFRGVATVVAKLFAVVRPDRAYFGQKDYQQTVVVKKLARDLNTGVSVLVCPTVREPDGLAMSSRNAYLKPNERMAATAIYRSLASARSAREAGEASAEALVKKVRDTLKGEPLIKTEYVSLVDADNLSELKNASGRALLALAVRVGGTRLIDNIIL